MKKKLGDIEYENRANLAELSTFRVRVGARIRVRVTVRIGVKVR